MPKIWLAEGGPGKKVVLNKYINKMPEMRHIQ